MPQNYPGRSKLIGKKFECSKTPGKFLVGGIKISEIKLEKVWEVEKCIRNILKVPIFREKFLKTVLEV